MKIYIDKFGPIENAVVEFAPLIVFSGDSNLGKSYTNYLFYYVIRSLVHIDDGSFVTKRLEKKNSTTISLKMVSNMLENKVESFMRSFLNAPEIDCKVRFELLPNEDEKKYHISYTEEKALKDKEDSFSNELSSVTVKVGSINS